MNEIIEWLIGIEEMASRVYEKAASRFSDDRELADFLRHLSSDEKVHHEIICTVAESLKGKKDYPSLISLDNETRQTTENYFLSVERKIDEGTLTKENMIICIVSIEFSEYNDTVLYAINTLKHTFSEFIPIAAKIQQHKKTIERFLKSRPEFKGCLATIRDLPSLWEEKILVVDDEKIIADLINAVLSDEGTIEWAVNGKEGLEKVGDKYYAAIITDLEMPVMNGIEFYKKAVERYPTIKDRFVFFTGSGREKYFSFFRENNLKYLSKPAQIKDVKKTVIDILNRE